MHTVTMAKEVLDLSLEDMINLPIANTMEYFTAEKLESLDIPTNAIPQVVEYVQPEKKRITININTSNLKHIDDFMKYRGVKNRSEFLEQSAMRIVSKSYSKGNGNNSWVGSPSFHTEQAMA